MRAPKASISSPESRREQASSLSEHQVRANRRQAKKAASTREKSRLRQPSKGMADARALWTNLKGEPRALPRHPGKQRREPRALFWHPHKQWRSRRRGAESMRCCPHRTLVAGAQVRNVGGLRWFGAFVHPFNPGYHRPGAVRLPFVGAPRLTPAPQSPRVSRIMIHRPWGERRNPLYGQSPWHASSGLTEGTGITLKSRATCLESRNRFTQRS
jgi:hypothetical protein